MDEMNVQLREATEADRESIAAVVAAAFGEAEGEEIANLVAALEGDPSAQPTLSLVAELDGEVVGHVLFTAAWIEPSHDQLPGASLLAPLAVHPDCQRGGIGSRLIAEGLGRLREAGVGLVFVLGHPGYYPRHGFVPAGIQGLDAPHPIPAEDAEAWMVQELQPGLIDKFSGQLRCAEAISDPKYWRE